MCCCHWSGLGSVINPFNVNAGSGLPQILLTPEHRVGGAPKQASADAQQHSDNDQRRVSQYAHVRTCSSDQEDNEPRGAEDCHEPTPNPRCPGADRPVAPARHERTR